MTLSITQAPKYDTNADGKLVNRATGVQIPSAEPVFILRAKDGKAIHALLSYFDACNDPRHRAVIKRRIAEFQAFAEGSPEIMREPDTAAPVLDMVPCTSSNIESTGYDVLSQTLGVKFKTGATHHYMNVPMDVVRQFRAAESAGSFFAKNIRSVFDSVGCTEAVTDSAPA